MLTWHRMLISMMKLLGDGQNDVHIHRQPFVSTKETLYYPVKLCPFPCIVQPLTLAIMNGDTLFLTQVTGELATRVDHISLLTTWPVSRILFFCWHFNLSSSLSLSLFLHRDNCGECGLVRCPKRQEDTPRFWRRGSNGELPGECDMHLFVKLHSPQFLQRVMSEIGFWI